MGRPFKCPCGSTNSVSKGRRRTKTMGERRIRLCKECGRKFTPKNQQQIEAGLPGPERSAQPVADSIPAPVQDAQPAIAPSPALPEAQEREPMPEA